MKYTTKGRDLTLVECRVCTERINKRFNILVRGRVRVLSMTYGIFNYFPSFRPSSWSLLSGRERPTRKSSPVHNFPTFLNSLRCHGHSVYIRIPEDVSSFLHVFLTSQGENVCYPYLSVQLLILSILIHSFHGLI